MYSITHNADLQIVHDTMLDRGFTLSTAESCTGGLLASLFTELAGSSAYFTGGVSTYSNEAKINLLGVEKRQLTEFGAVSREVAESMAAGVCKLLNTNFGMALTGVAGPTGGTLSKPVGTVWCGLSYDGNTEAFLLKCSGSRHEIRAQAMEQALNILRQKLDEGL